jgi:hypothetical protein
MSASPSGFVQCKPPAGAMKRQPRNSYGFTLTLLCAFMAAASPHALAQTHENSAAEAFTASNHWSREALRRLGEAGLLDPSAVLVSWPMRSSDVRQLLRLAVANSDRSRSSALRNQAQAFVVAFDEEYPDQTGRPASLVGRLDDGWDARAGALRAGTTFWTDGVGWRYPGPSPTGDLSTPFALGTVSAIAGPRLAASVTARVGRSGVEARETYATGRFGVVDVWGGRRGVGFGASHGESLVLSEGALFDGVGFELNRGIKLPGILGALGPVRGTTLVARMNRSGADLHPWFAAMRISFAPSSSVSIGMNRATMFGGSTNPARTTVSNVVLMFFGVSGQFGKSSDYENQVASMDFLWRTRAGGLPLAFYGEYGVDDTGFAFLHVPGWTAGAEIPSVPGAEAIAIGVEHTRLPHSTLHYPPWYQHGPLGDGWTDRGALLGHPLGGEGSEWLVRWRYDAPRALIAGGNVFTRARGSENLFSPDHGGRSVGGALQVVLRGTRRFRIKGATELEHGSGWWNRTATLGTELTF